MKTLLTIDTSAEYCSIALFYNETLRCRQEKGFKSHANVILAFVEELLSDAGIVLSQVDTLIYTKGPGSFTGLRISACVAQGLAISQNIPVIGISTLQALAQGAYRQLNTPKVWVVNDARMNEVYHAPFQLNEQGFMACIEEDKVESLECLSWNINEWTYVGSGLMLDNAIIPKDILSESKLIQFEPIDLITLAGFKTPLSAQFALPTYIRNNVAHKKRDLHG